MTTLRAMIHSAKERALKCPELLFQAVSQIKTWIKNGLKFCKNTMRALYAWLKYIVTHLPTIMRFLGEMLKEVGVLLGNVVYTLGKKLGNSDVFNAILEVAKQVFGITSTEAADVSEAIVQTQESLDNLELQSGAGSITPAFNVKKSSTLHHEKLSEETKPISAFKASPFNI